MLMRRVAILGWVPITQLQVAGGIWSRLSQTQCNTFVMSVHAELSSRSVSRAF